MFLKGICLILVFAAPVWSDYGSYYDGSGQRVQLPAERNLNNLFYKPTISPPTPASPTKDNYKRRSWNSFPQYYPVPWWQSYYPYYPPYGQIVPQPRPTPTPKPPTTTPTLLWPPYCESYPTSGFCQALLPPQAWCISLPTYPNCDKWPAITSTTKVCEVASFLRQCQTSPPSDVTICETVPDLPACNPGVPTEPLFCLILQNLPECRLCAWNPTATGCEVCATATPDPAICPLV